MSHDEQDLEIGRLIREYSERKKTLAALSSKLSRMSRTFQSVAAILSGLTPENYDAVTDQLENEITTASSDVDLSSTLKSVREYRELNRQLGIDRHNLKQYGIDY